MKLLLPVILIGLAVDFAWDWLLAQFYVSGLAFSSAVVWTLLSAAWQTSFLFALLVLYTRGFELPDRLVVCAVAGAAQALLSRFGQGAAFAGLFSAAGLLEFAAATAVGASAAFVPLLEAPLAERLRASLPDPSAALPISIGAAFAVLTIVAGVPRWIVFGMGPSLLGIVSAVIPGALVALAAMLYLRLPASAQVRSELLSEN